MGHPKDERADLEQNANSSSQSRSSSSSSGGASDDKTTGGANANEKGEKGGKRTGEGERPQRRWCYVSDTVVRLASLEEVLQAKAYICMYERC